MNTMLFDSIASGVEKVLAEKLPHLSSCRFLVGLSGGADSVALMHIVRALGEKHGFSVCAVHVDHGLRGDAAKADAAFCQALCDEMGVTLYTYALSGLDGESGLETKARNARYDCFKKAYTAAKADALLLAHHAFDQAETLLMHLMRGSGVHGLGGMRKVSVRQGMTIIRPMLGFSKEDILALELAHCHDATNDVADNLRNALRLDVMPRLEALWQGASKRMANSALLIADEDDFMSLQAMAYDTSSPYFPRAVLEKMHPALMRRVLRRFIGDEDLEMQKVLEIQSRLQLGVQTRINLQKGGAVELSYRYVHDLRRTLSFVKEVTVSEWSQDRGYGDGKRTQVMPKKFVEAGTWRVWREGDVIRPFGMSGHKSLQDYFVDQKVDRPFRSAIPLLCMGSEVLWLPGIGASALCSAKPNEEMFFLSATHPMPWYEIDEGDNQR